MSLFRSCLVLFVLLRLQLSTLFPYTTLFRSERALGEHHAIAGQVIGAQVNIDIGFGVLLWNKEDGVFPAFIHRADRKSTRLNSSHVKISYAVFCLKKKKMDLTYIHGFD